MRGLLALVVVAACGDNRSFDTIEVVGHTDLGARGMNAAMAIAGDTAYIGSRIDNKPILIVDIADPAAPAVVGEIPGLPAMSSRELRAFGDVLVVLQIRCDPQLHGCAATGAVRERIELYDIRNRLAPQLLSTYEIAGVGLRPKNPHEFYLRRDADRVLLYIAAPPVVIEIVDITDPAAPTQVVAWNPNIPAEGGDDIIHSVSVSADGGRLYLAHQLSGVFVADVTVNPPTLITPVDKGADFAPPGTVGPHSVVEVPGRNFLLATEEVYPPPYGTGCPWGLLRTVDISDPTAPAVLGQIGVAENDPAICATGTFDRISFTAHNPTATRDLAFVTWHAAGLQVIDLSDPSALQILGEFRPEPLPSVTMEDPGLGGAPIEMWSYPVIKRGLIYVIDVRNGLYVLRYHGFHQEQVDSESFREGNSSL